MAAVQPVAAQAGEARQRQQRRDRAGEDGQHQQGVGGDVGGGAHRIAGGPADPDQRQARQVGAQRRGTLVGEGRCAKEDALLPASAGQFVLVGDVGHGGADADDQLGDGGAGEDDDQGQEQGGGPSARRRRPAGEVEQHGQGVQRHPEQAADDHGVALVEPDEETPRHPVAEHAAQGAGNQHAQDLKLVQLPEEGEHVQARGPGHAEGDDDEDEAEHHPSERGVLHGCPGFQHHVPGAHPRFRRPRLGQVRDAAAGSPGGGEDADGHQEA